MPQLNLKDRTIEAKVAYAGALSSGRRTNLSRLQGSYPEGRGADVVTRELGEDRLLSVRWTPAHLDQMNGCEVALQLCALEGEVHTAEGRRALLDGVDGVVMVVDGRASALETTRRAVADLKRDCIDAGLATDRVPMVLQINKRDAADAMPIEELLRELGAPPWSHVEATASTGAGVIETVCEAARLVARAIRQPPAESKVAPVPARARFDAVDRELELVRAEHSALAARQATLEATLAALVSAMRVGLDAIPR